MKRGISILFFGLLVAVLGYCSTYFIGTAKPRGLMQSSQPELEWLKAEFGLNEADFKRISELHESYLPQCLERCRKINALNDDLSKALSAAREMTPELEWFLQERAQLRANCQSEMLKHFFEVSRTMPREQGERYLAWVREHTCLREPGMSHDAGDRTRTAPGHHP
jgi:hypothetical protein